MSCDPADTGLAAGLDPPEQPAAVIAATAAVASAAVSARIEVIPLSCPGKPVGHHREAGRA